LFIGEQNFLYKKKINLLVKTIGMDSETQEFTPENVVVTESRMLSKDIPGCEDDYYRFILCCFRITEGWFDALALLCTLFSQFMGALATLGSLSEETTKQIGVSIVVLSAINILLMSLKRLTQNRAEQRQKQLADLVKASV
jgi:hypothetical protein